MKLIVGLGNPGAKYQKTRHNIGFRLIDKLAGDLELNFRTNQKLHSEIATIKGSLILMKPQTFMNNSGIAVKAVMRKQGIKPEDVLVIYDDIDMILGKVRFKAEGSSGGHNGMQSVIDALGTNAIARIKIGIGRSDRLPPDKHVLGMFSKEELPQIKMSLEEADKLIKTKFPIEK
ncbi:aminoacyl-tRNA hydrolase [Patescibacteria group bacterium]|nr:aminoacyl-tRNA hydrolase [Patescibacteria group bacterium]